MDKRQKEYKEFLNQMQDDSFNRQRELERERSILSMLCRDGDTTAYLDVAKLIAEERREPPVYYYSKNTITPFLKKAFDLIITSYISDWKPLTIEEVQEIFTAAFSSNDIAVDAAEQLINLKSPNLLEILTANIFCCIWKIIQT